jgi:hypothetical protein
MGSGNKRKSNDVVRINRVKPAGTGGGSGGGSPASRDINKVCPPAFDVRITSKHPLTEKTPVITKERELFVLGESVGNLSDEHIRIITECAGEGIHYVGRVFINDNKKTYARFEQSSRG